MSIKQRLLTRQTHERALSRKVIVKKMALNRLKLVGVGIAKISVKNKRLMLFNQWNTPKGTSVCTRGW